MPQLLSPKTLAACFGVAERTIYNRHSMGRDLPPAIKLGRLVRFHLADVNAWLDAKRQAATSSLPASPPQSVSQEAKAGPMRSRGPSR
ncbi:helix-turn-helix domain-containing protein [Zoogloea sp. LCSB751]|uniref:helix-turn-helix transcriptional regulator n=1 Tax=Zoogloea sp. LCSB751 TaxID=1965277 RepID=UPI0009A52339